MTPEQFQKAVLRGVSASPFKTTQVAPLILLRGNQRTELEGCVIEVQDNKAEAEEYGIERMTNLSAQIPKLILSQPPRLDLDALEYQGQQYTLSLVEGAEAYSPVWIVEASAPFKS